MTKKEWKKEVKKEDSIAPNIPDTKEQKKFGDQTPKAKFGDANAKPKFQGGVEKPPMLK